MTAFLQNIDLALSTALAFDNLVYCMLGVTLGMIVGVLPGIGHFAAITMLMPLTFHAPPTASLVMLAGIYYGAQYGGSVASILLNLPGTASTAVTCLDGYPMAQQGRAGVALFMTTFASFLGSILAIVALVALAPPLAAVGLKFISADYFSMMVLGLVATAILVKGSPLLGVASVVIGLMLGLVGTDVNTGMIRFTFGIPQLFDGVSIVALAMALLGLSEVISSAGLKEEHVKMGQRVTLRSLMPTAADLRQSWWPILRGSLVGIGVGVLPGAGGGSMASFMAYAVEKRISRTPHRFGQGAIEGITGPEAANNATAQAAFIPTLTLGIPGDAVMALMLGALLIHGIQPGPRVVTENPELFWGLVGSFFVGNVLLLILNIPLIQIWVKILQIPYRFLFPSVVTLIAVGVYSISHSYVDVLSVALFALVGYIMVLIGFEPAPILLGYILGPLLEENFRRTMMLTGGDLLVFVERPVSAAFLGVSLLIVLWTLLPALKARSKPQPEAAG
ncbi:tripartite tricarboxylate transporter permease [Propylenella binzhouense]|uniref:Tripartite tricarboxylate transporter permease n=1 Tax=Propylenella binzhouense TaxID=2555902 RepID=A0A964WVP4_9HYPH|nr:tripartite tricarboxylate transporter permease [Propylenella binzhouense]MYZ50452.1 tripartite tricarboxylate transporter permease [Propylenella binzhouense]